MENGTRNGAHSVPAPGTSHPPHTTFPDGKMGLQAEEELPTAPSPPQGCPSHSAMGALQESIHWERRKSSASPAEHSQASSLPSQEGITAGTLCAPSEGHGGLQEHRCETRTYGSWVPTGCNAAVSRDTCLQQQHHNQHPPNRPPPGPFPAHGKPAASQDQAALTHPCPAHTYPSSLALGGSIPDHPQPPPWSRIPASPPPHWLGRMDGGGGKGMKHPDF